MRTKSNDLKSEQQTRRIGRRPRTLHVTVEPAPQTDVSASELAAFQTAFDDLVALAVKRGLQRGTLDQTADGRIVPAKRSRGKQ